MFYIHLSTAAGLHGILPGQFLIIDPRLQDDGLSMHMLKNCSDLSQLYVMG